MANKKVNKKEKTPLIKTKQKLDNSIEVEITKSPAKTKTGRVVVWLIVIGTVVVPIAGLIYLFFNM